MNDIRKGGEELKVTDEEPGLDGMKGMLKKKEWYRYHSHQKIVQIYGSDDGGNDAAWKQDNWSKMSAIADARMRDVYVLCNLAVLGFSIAAAVMGSGVAVGLALASAIVGIAWNYFDIAGGAVVAAGKRSMVIRWVHWAIFSGVFS